MPELSYGPDGRFTMMPTVVASGWMISIAWHPSAAAPR